MRERVAGTLEAVESIYESIDKECGINITSHRTSSKDKEAIAKERLLLDSTLPQRTNLSPENIYDLLKLCLITTCFQWREKYYE